MSAVGLKNIFALLQTVNIGNDGVDTYTAKSKMYSKRPVFIMSETKNHASRKARLTLPTSPAKVLARLRALKNEKISTEKIRRINNFCETNCIEWFSQARVPNATNP